MPTNPDLQSEVLHSENHSKLSSEEIAKALARHNKNHSPDQVAGAAAKALKASGTNPNAAGKGKKAPKA